jgi:hypothetical protein
VKSGPEAAKEWSSRELAKVNCDYQGTTDQDLLKRDMASRLVNYLTEEITAGRVVVFHNGTLGVL